ncbi:hypothetical protein BCR34DRAFT_605359 [Clohesyomyces aquaticus]|uniref:Uncharacterized protein n=1 Tax=Clohesyomyces aquaticus TaxID=1231657 RepID=A0A1Y1YYC9_9PLEO|nr:hypothetical protein BCR34DRAFT_605359 [Clohesyomyces aquaticus]
MKFTLAIASTLFATAITAAPSAIQARNGKYPEATVSVINDITGAHAPITLGADGSEHRVGDLFTGTPIDNAGTILATSAQLTMFPQGVECSFYLPGGKPIILDSQAHTFAQLDGNPDAACTVVLNDFIFSCKMVKLPWQ